VFAKLSKAFQVAGRPIFSKSSLLRGLPFRSRSRRILGSLLRGDARGRFEPHMKISANIGGTPTQHNGPLYGTELAKESYGNLLGVFRHPARRIRSFNTRA
jgi:hypothetical protein